MKVKKNQNENIFSLDKWWWEKFDLLANDLEKEALLLQIIRQKQDYLDLLLDEMK